MNPLVDYIQDKYPEWKAPKETGKWMACLCPFHGDTSPSASVSYEYQYFRCRACGLKGFLSHLIAHEEEVPFGEAKRRAEKLSEGSGYPVQSKPSRKSGRRVFGR